MAGSANDPAPVDARIVSGAMCVWWGSIAEIGEKPSGLPCCPVCGGVLFEVANIDEWWAGVRTFELSGNPGYRKLIEFVRGKHFRSMTEAQQALDAQINAQMLEVRR